MHTEFMLAHASPIVLSEGLKAQLQKMTRDGRAPIA
jgi:hypothetical protein